MLSRSYLEQLAALLSVIGSAWAKTVTTTNGTIEGGKCDGYDVNSFLAIPYAQPPVGTSGPALFSACHVLFIIAVIDVLRKHLVMESG